MTTFELNLPEQPPIGSFVVDNKGLEWRRVNETEWSNLGQYWSWVNLLQRGPLTLKESEPKQGEARRLKGTSTVFAIYIDGQWHKYQSLPMGIVQVSETVDREDLE